MLLQVALFQRVVSRIPERDPLLRIAVGGEKRLARRALCRRVSTPNRQVVCLVRRCNGRRVWMGRRRRVGTLSRAAGEPHNARQQTSKKKRSRYGHGRLPVLTAVRLARPSPLVKTLMQRELVQPRAEISVGPPPHCGSRCSSPQSAKQSGGLTLKGKLVRRQAVRGNPL